MPDLCATLVPALGVDGLVSCSRPQRQTGRHGDAWSTRCWRRARRAARRGARALPSERQFCRATLHACARRPATRCLAYSLWRLRFIVKWPSSSSRCRSSASSLPTTSRCSIVVYYQEVPTRVPTAVGGDGGARARRLCSDSSHCANRARRANFRMVARAKSGNRGRCFALS